MQATREIVSKLIERAMLPLNIGLGLSGAILAMLAELFGMIRNN